jgi:phospholipid/cholesterol/gamma-HCH transport system substrate-binding protein
MDIQFKRIEKIVGTFILCIVILLLTTVIIIGRGKDWFKKYITYYTTFSESYNLEVNTAVKLFKADIGKVKEITLVGDRVKVQLAIMEEYTGRIRTDAYVIVESPTIIGSEYVSLRPGSTDATPIPENGMIPSRKKKSIADLLSEFEVEKTAKMIVKAAQDLSEFVQTIRDPQGPLFSILDNVNQISLHIEGITRDIQAGKGTAGRLLKSRELINSIHAKLDKVGGILDNIRKASEKTPTAMDQVQESLASVQEIGDGVVDAVSRIKPILSDVNEAVDTLKVILENIKKGSEDVPQITQSAKGGVQEIRDGVKNIDKVVQSLQQNFLIKPNLPPEPGGENLDAGLRQ